MSMTNLPDLPHTDYAKAVQAYEKFQADLADARAEVVRLRGPAGGRSPDETGTLRWLGGDLEKARQADLAASATALRDGGKDPGPVNEKRVAKALEDAERKVGVLEQAVVQAEAAITDLLTDRADELVEAAAHAVDAEREEYEAAIAGLEAARAKFWATHYLVTWLSGDPANTRYKAGLPAMEFGGLIQPNGESARLEPVLEALRQEANPPVAERQPTTMRWKREVVYGDAGQRSAVIEERYIPVPVYADETEQAG